MLLFMMEKEQLLQYTHYHSTHNIIVHTYTVLSNMSIYKGKPETSLVTDFYFIPH